MAFIVGDTFKSCQWIKQTHIIKLALLRGPFSQSSTLLSVDNAEQKGGLPGAFTQEVGGIQGGCPGYSTLHYSQCSQKSPIPANN